MFDVILAYLKQNGDFDSPFVKAYQDRYNVTDQELKDWVSLEVERVINT